VKGAKENSLARLYFLMMTSWSIKQVSHCCFFNLGFARCIGFSSAFHGSAGASQRESREAFMRKGDERRTDGRLSGLSTRMYGTGSLDNSL
jgi:hypothetical protein